MTITTTCVPSYTDPATLMFGPEILDKGYVKRATLDLSTKVGAWVILCVGRTHTTGLTGNWYLAIRRMFLNKTQSVARSVDYVGGSTTGSTAYSGHTTPATAGSVIIPLGSTNVTNLGTANALLLLSGHTQPSGLTNGITAGISSAEFVRLAKATAAGTQFTIDAPITAGRVSSEIMTNQAEIYGPIWLSGGCQYEIILDAGGVTAGEPLIIAGYQQTYDSDVSTT